MGKTLNRHLTKEDKHIHFLKYMKKKLSTLLIRQLKIKNNNKVPLYILVKWLKSRKKLTINYWQEWRTTDTLIHCK